MNVQILKRIADIESKVQRPAATPSLIMIVYDRNAGEWRITESYAIGQGSKQAFKERQQTAKQLKDYLFPAAGNARVIANTFGSPEPAIHENLYYFDLKELRRDLEPGRSGRVSIEAIRPDDDSEITCEIVVFTN